MKTYTRTEYSAKNTYIATFSRMIAILMGFVIRVVFTHTLNENYVGLNGLFTDILNVLSLSELGIETAITYALYRPIAEGNKEEQKSLMRIFCWYYRIVACAVLFFGLLLVPFMNLLIKNQPEVDHLIGIYLLYLINSAISYLFIYKITLIDAHQLMYIGVLYQTSFWVLQDILQIIVLLYTKNFILFLMIYIICTIGSNICISRKANRLYPYLLEKNVIPLDIQKKKEIFKNVRAMFLHKIGNVVINNTDNLILSSFVGIASVGIYSNYFLIIQSINQIISQMLRAITASVGNLGVEKEPKKMKRVYETAFFVSHWVYGLGAICLYEVLNPFVMLSFGSNYLFTRNIELILCINFFIIGMKDTTLVFRNSLGLFWFDRYLSLAGAAINLVASMVLVHQFGIIGVFIGTLISIILTTAWLEPYLFYKNYLGMTFRSYFKNYICYSLSIAVIWWITDVLCRQVVAGLVVLIPIRLLICMTFPNLVMLLLYYRTKEFHMVLEKIKVLWKKIDLRDDKENRERKQILTEEYTCLLEILRDCLSEKPNGHTMDKNELTWQQWNNVYQLANKHAVISLCYEEMKEEKAIPPDLFENIQRLSRQTVQQNYKLLYLTNYIVKLLEGESVAVLVLKGVATASFYPYPELRKSGDIDLLVTRGADFIKTCNLMEEHGFQRKEIQRSNHHVAFESKEGIMVEIHTMLASPFDNQRMNHYLEDISSEFYQHAIRKNILGSWLPIPSDAYHAYYLLLHMLQHYLRAGFGLKLLCDWVVFWKRDIEAEEKENFLRLVEESGLHGFAQRITDLCICYLGLEKEKVSFIEMEALNREELKEFMLDILEAEEFGKSNKDRMVVLRDTSIPAYFREFHHQMRLNYPKLGKNVLLWPVLWISTLMVFLYNNRKIRKISLWAIMKKTHSRSKSKKSMKLFHITDHVSK